MQKSKKECKQKKNDLTSDAQTFTDMELVCCHEHSEHALRSAQCMAPVVIRYIVPVASSHSQNPLTQALQGEA